MTQGEKVAGHPLISKMESFPIAWLFILDIRWAFRYASANERSSRDVCMYIPKHVRVFPKISESLAIFDGTSWHDFI